jgi:hypothetical protein
MVFAIDCLLIPSIISPLPSDIEATKTHADIF